ncbi:26S proteasome non-ATPase regulatory subunit 10 [Porphyridium purpureum]|uniref:26S proteasome non-ATPase regulatory subunit 10 n=1 Tax=Porphyridium purpureum TaxID=35688 RepID=A0A5J4YR45_PORPP|nr:26S proteasome non-ATPase regulatory subunit 10 [Porphyridium purpureum]|eukprot:POR6843..scf236_6
MGLGMDLRGAVERNEVGYVESELEKVMGKGAAGSGVADGALMLDEADEDGRTLLHEACVHKNGGEMVELLLRAGCDVRVADGAGLTPLHVAATVGALSTVRALLQRLMPLHEALPQRQRKTQLINARSNDARLTALHRAASKGHAAVVNELIQAGAYLDAKDKYQNTPLMRAAGSGYTAVMSLLMDAGADTRPINNEGDNALHVACENAHEAAALLLWTSEHGKALRMARNNAELLPREVANDSLKSKLVSCSAEQ